MAKGIVIAAPASGSGKTVVTLGLLRALRNRGLRVASAKAGPDYIDPRYHEAATGRPCLNLDPWAMSGAQIAHYRSRLATGADIVVVEGVMGLFDKPVGVVGSTGDLAAELGYPILLVVDCSRMAQTIGALLTGFQMECGSIVGAIFNRVASPRHERALREGVPWQTIVGSVHSNDALRLPSRHLGLVQAGEHGDIETFIEAAAKLIEGSIDIDALLREAIAVSAPAVFTPPALAPLGQRIAVASDVAFAFAYSHVLEDWRAQGAEIVPFSPLANDAPASAADAVFLPGGYPELHAGMLASNQTFLEGLREADRNGKLVYGECGGFMVLGEYLVGATGERHRMSGLLPLGTTFARRRLHLGYRILEPHSDIPWPHALRGHEFHYSTIDWQGDAEPLFEASDAQENVLGHVGLRRGKTMGSYAHAIARDWP